MGYYHTKIHSCITVNDDPAYLSNRMKLQTLTERELHELAAPMPAGGPADTPENNALPSLDRCA